jgi:hypothetical protein
VTALADKLQLPTELVDRQLEYLEGVEEYDTNRQGADVGNLLATHPTLYHWLRDRDNAALASGEIPVLRRIHQFMEMNYPQPAPLSPLAEKSGFWRDVTVAGARTLGAFYLIDEESRQAADDMGQASAEASPGFGGDIRRGAAGVTADLPLLLLGAGVAGGAAKTWTALRVSRALLPVLGRVGTRAVQSFAVASAANLPIGIRETAAVGQEHGLVSGLVQGAINTLIPGLFGRSGLERGLLPKTVAQAGRQASLNLFRETAMEGAEEITTELSSAIYEAMSGDDPTALQGDKLFRRLSVAGTLGALMGGVFNLPEALQHRATAVGQNITLSAQEAEARKVLIETAMASKTRENGPGRFQAMVEAATKGNAMIYHQAADWEAYWTGRKMDPMAQAVAFGVDANVYATAKATGGLVPVPLGPALSKMDPADQVFFQGGTSRPDAIPSKDLQGATDRLRKELTEQVAEQARAADPESINRVEQIIATQLTAAGTESGTATTQAKVAARMFHRIADRLVPADAPDAPAVVAEESTATVPVGATNEESSPVQPTAPAPALSGQPGVVSIRAERVESLAMELFAKHWAGVTSGDAPGAWSAAQQIDATDALIARVKKGERPTDRDIYGPSLLEYLQVKGIVDHGGELAYLDLNKKMGKGGRLVRKNGQTLDVAREAVLEEGYELSEDSINGLLRAISDEISGEKLYNPANFREEQLATRNAMDAIEQYAKDAGIDDVSTASAEDIRAAVELGSRQSMEQTKDTPRGALAIGPGRRMSIKLLEGADLSTFLHEMGHMYLELLSEYAPKSTKMAEDLTTLRTWMSEMDVNEIKQEAVALAKTDAEKLALGTLTKDEIVASAKSFTGNALILRAFHERLARGFEAYLLEGKAPSRSLRNVFAAMKGWMLAIYSSIRNLNVKLTPSVRAVFDRALATDAEISEAVDEMQVRTYLTREQALKEGWKESQWDSYVQSVALAQEEAESRLRAMVMKGHMQASKDLQRLEEQEVRAAVGIAVNRRQDFVAIRALQIGQLPEGMTKPDGVKLKLDRDSLIAEFGASSLDMLPGPNKKDATEPKRNAGPIIYAKSGGLNLTEAAAMFGYPSPQKLWEALVNAPDRMTLIDTETREEIRRRHPDPALNGEASAEAAFIVADEMAGEVLAQEIEHLSRRLGSEAAPREVMRKAAGEIISEMKAMDIRPDSYKSTAEKAGREKFRKVAEMLDANPEARAALEREVYTAAQRQLMNLELYRAAKIAVDEAQSGRVYLDAFNSLEKRAKIGKSGGLEYVVRMRSNGDLAQDENGEDLIFDSEREARAAADAVGGVIDRVSGYLEQMDQVLDSVDLRRASVKDLRRRESLIKWIRRQTDRGEMVDIPALAETLGNTPWMSLTINQQRAVTDAMKNIEHLANTRSKMMDAQDARQFGAVVDTLSSSLEENARRVVVPKSTGKSAWDRTAHLGMTFWNAQVKDAFLVREMDGDKDGGEAFKNITDKRSRAASHESILFHDFAKVFDKANKTWGKKLGMFASAVPGTNMRITNENRIMYACYWGNADGRQRVLQSIAMAGYGESDVQAVLNSLDEADIKLVHEIWALANKHWYDLKAVDQRTTGLAPTKVEATPYKTKAGTLSGGYMPIMYDASESLNTANMEAQEEAVNSLKAANRVAGTRRRASKQRAKSVSNRALRFDLTAFASAMSETIHDITHREMLIDQNRLLRDPDVSEAIMKYHGRAALDQLYNATAAVAAGETGPKNAFDSVASKMRRGIAAAVFTFNATSALMQITGITQSMVRVGPKHMLSAVGRIFSTAAQMDSAFQEAQDKSEFMRTRMITYLREVNDAVRLVGANRTLENIKYVGYWPMTRMQQMVDTITWHAAYEKSMAESVGKLDVAEAEKLAIAVANQTVVDTQGSGRATDMAAVQRGSELAKMMTTFYSYFNVTFNLQRSAWRTAYAKSAPGARISAWVKFTTDTMLIWMLPAAMSAMIRGALTGGDDGDDDEMDVSKISKKFMDNQISYGLGMVVGARELAGAFGGHYGYHGPAGFRNFQVLSSLLTQIREGEPDTAALKAVVSGAGLFGLPAVAANRAIDAFLADEESGVNAQAIRHALFGRPK